MSDDRSTETARILADAAALAGMVISGDRRVAESDAARLLGLAHGTLRNLRQEGRGPRAYSIGMNGARISYRLDDLASWIEAAREEDF